MIPTPAVRRRYRQVLRALRAECPTVLPVRVVLDASPAKPLSGKAWRSMPAWAAVVYDRKGRPAGFRVVIKTSMYERGAKRARAFYPSEIADLLIHEWAHCMAWSADHQDLGDHGPAYWQSHGVCYRAVIED